MTEEMGFRGCRVYCDYAAYTSCGPRFRYLGTLIPNEQNGRTPEEQRAKLAKECRRKRLGDVELVQGDRGPELWIVP